MLEKQCSCFKYQQTGVPCPCAIAALITLRKSKADILGSESHFHEHLLARKLLETFKKGVFANIPGDEEVNDYLKIIQSALSLPMKVKITKKLSVSYSKKRYRSKGI